MTLKPEMTFGRLKETSFIAIALNLEFSIAPKQESFPNTTEVH